MQECLIVTCNKKQLLLYLSLAKHALQEIGLSEKNDNNLSGLSNAIYLQFRWYWTPESLFNTIVSLSSTVRGGCWVIWFQYF